MHEIHYCYIINVHCTKFVQYPVTITGRQSIVTTMSHSQTVARSVIRWLFLQHHAVINPLGVSIWLQAIWLKNVNRCWNMYYAMSRLKKNSQASENVRFLYATLLIISSFYVITMASSQADHFETLNYLLENGVTEYWNKF